MGHIARWIVHHEDGSVHVTSDETAVEYYRRHDLTVEGPLVPADAYAAAVDALRQPERRGQS